MGLLFSKFIITKNLAPHFFHLKKFLVNHIGIAHNNKLRNT